MTPNAPCRPVVVTPTYNNAGTLGGVLRAVAALDLPVIVVNDGSTDTTAAVIDAFRAEHGALLINALRHERNHGKATALRTGFTEAVRRGFTHAVTIDTDGQHDAADLPRLIEQTRANPHALVLGVRTVVTTQAPPRNAAGRAASNLLVYLECGRSVADTQTGLRVYPLELVEAIPCRGRRYAFETEIIVRAVRAGAHIVEVPIESRYLPAGERVSHFRPWIDSLRLARVHARLLAGALVPYRLGARWRDPPDAGTPTLPWRRRFWNWISPVRAWRELRETPEQRGRLAAGVALGVFIANLPIYPLQTLAALFTARRLHLHPLSVVLGTQLAIPPIGPVLVVAAICVGHFILHGNWPSPESFEALHDHLLSAFGSVLLEWAVGALVIGAVLAPIAFGVSLALLRMVPVKQPAAVADDA